MKKKIAALVLIMCVSIISGGVIASASSKGSYRTWFIDYIPGYSTADATAIMYDNKADTSGYYMLHCDAFGASSSYVQVTCTSKSAASVSLSSSGDWTRNYNSVPSKNARVDFRAKYMASDLSNARCMTNGKVIA